MLTLLALLLSIINVLVSANFLPHLAPQIAVQRLSEVHTLLLRWKHVIWPE